MTFEKHKCLACLYYRPQASYVDAYKQQIGSGVYGPIIEALKDVQSEETRVLESEVELQYELVVNGNDEAWPEVPRFAPLCVASGGKFIPGLKNRGGHCKDFKEASNREGNRCSSCKFVVPAAQHLGSRQSTYNPSLSLSHDTSRQIFEIDREIAKANATAQAIEIQQAFFNDGHISVASFLPTCGVRAKDGQCYVVPFCNLRHDCPDHAPRIPVTEKFLKLIGDSRTAGPDDELLRNSIELACFVAEAGADHPEVLLDRVEQWAKDDPRRVPGKLWAEECVNTRWPKKNPGGKAGKPGKGPKHPGKMLLPVIAGCDVLEWGLLAALSRGSDESAFAAANAICQQLVEFLIAVISPFEAAQCIDASLLLIQDKNLFSQTTRDCLDGFARRLRSRSENLRLAGERDIVTYLEQLLAAISSPVAFAIGKKVDPAYWTKLTAFTGCEEYVQEMRQRMETKRRSAQADASEIISFLIQLAEADLEKRRSFLKAVLAKNQEYHETECEDYVNFMELLESLPARGQRQMAKKIADGLAGQFGGKKGGGGLLAQLSGAVPGNELQQILGAMSQAQDQPLSSDPQQRAQFQSWYWSTNKALLESRQLTAKLLFSRGAAPITPCALEELKREPQPGPIADTVEEAVQQPIARTLENFHAKRLGAPNEIAGKYFTAIRRIAVPRILEVIL